MTGILYQQGAEPIDWAYCYCCVDHFHRLAPQFLDLSNQKETDDDDNPN